MTAYQIIIILILLGNLGINVYYRHKASKGLNFTVPEETKEETKKEEQA